MPEPEPTKPALRETTTKLRSSPAFASNYSKLKLLLWKNFLLQKRHKRQTFFEILAPVLFCFVIIMLRYLVLPKKFPGVSNYEKFPVWNEKFIFNFPKKDKQNVSIAFSPDGALTRPLIAGLLSTLKGLELPNYPQIATEPLGFFSALAMEQALTGPHAMDRILAGVEFVDRLNQTVWPDEVVFSLRFPATMSTFINVLPPAASWHTYLLVPLFQHPGPRFPGDRHGGKYPGYHSEMFLMLQYYISWNIIKSKSAVEFGENINIQRYPTMSFLDDKMTLILERFMSLFIMLSFVYCAVNTVRAIAIEKELQLKEAMKIMGMPYHLHWIAWFIKSISCLTISIFLMTCLLKIPWASKDGKRYAAINFTSWGMMIFILLIYVISSLFFCFMISVFFSKANTAAAFTGLIWFVTYTFYTIIQVLPVKIPAAVKTILCLIPNAAMGFIFEMLVMQEGTMRGLLFSELFRPVSLNSSFAPAHVIIMFILDCFIFMLITLYVEKTKPGIYGLPLPWNFPYLWLKNKIQKKRGSIADSVSRATFSDDTISTSVIHDHAPEGKAMVLESKNLVKVFNGKKAVNGLNLRLYEDEITVLLGHNGAGKTTTISMLTGMIPPTDGKVLIMGYDIFEENDEARRYIGLCPQHNVLFPDLTVAEHIEFYARLKGVETENVHNEIEHFLKILKMEKKRDALASNLSGGQKRRLSVCTAMCGGSKMVFLDEPSSGLDPLSRRRLWDLLLLQKQGKTILITTHFMDEAEVLGDRIAVMSAGRLQCFGTPHFLKQHYGATYKLIIVKKEGCNVKKIHELLNKNIHGAKLDADIGTELVYTLPKSETSKFQKLLTKLEGKGKQLKVQSFGISYATLEHVFMQAGSEEKKEELSLIEVNERISSEENTKRSDSYEKVTGRNLQKNHVRAIFLKKFLIIKRSYVPTLLQLLTFVVHVILVILLMQAWTHYGVLNPLKMSIDNGLRKSLTLMAYDADNKFTAAYRSVFKDFKPDLELRDIGNDDMNKAYMDMYRFQECVVRDSLFTGVSVTGTEVTAWFSNFGYHDIALSLGLVISALAKLVSPTTKVECYNKPLPYAIDEQSSIAAAGGTALGFHLTYSMLFCTAFFCAFFIMHCIRERVTQAKLLQLMTGLKPVVLWSCTFLVDWLIYIVIVFIGITILFCAREQVLNSFFQFVRLNFAFMVFGLASIPIHYLMSLYIDVPSIGFTRMCFINLFCGIIPYLLVEIFYIPDLDLENIRQAVEIICLIIPAFCLSQAIKYLCEVEAFIITCDKACSVYLPHMKNCTVDYICQHVWDKCCMGASPHLKFEKPGIGKHLLSMFIVGVAVFALLMMTEYRMFSKLKHKLGCHRKKTAPPAVTDKDIDVISERHYVSSVINSREEMDKHALLTQDLSKCFKRYVAVNRITMSLKKGECLGLLGINGAGKTTTYKMIAGDETPSSGDAWVEHRSIRSRLNRIQILGHVSYCPQFEALFENLSGRENMKIYCLLRGIPEDYGLSVAEKMVTELGFMRHFDKRMKDCSGGTQRKLSTALALLGDSRLVLLDEPTTGMDPASKRKVWKVVLDAIQVKNSSTQDSREISKTNFKPDANKEVRNIAKSKMDTTQSKMNTTKSKMDTTQSKMDTTKSKMDTTQSKVDTTKSKMDTTQSKMDTTKSKMDTTKSKMDTTKSNMDRSAMESTSVSIKEDDYKRGVLLTSHSMEECEALCTRLTVMAGGRLHCMGPLQHLKNKYSSGYTLNFRYESDEQEEHMKKYLEEHFENPALIEKFHGTSSYYLSNSSIPWSKMFEILEKAQKEHGIEDYTINQTSLEQVFLRLVRSDEEKED